MTTEISNIPGITESPQEALTRDFKKILGKADHLLRDAGHSVAEEFSATRHAMSEKASGAANVTQEYVLANPWKLVAAAAAVGIFFGALISRR